ncbi:MAG: sugar ABC transporter permease, partial [Candidatus Hydrogenedentes bacterium]|nr:sugar ABC transporter permease [Candidatus Hydrogenedentota bacterium]
DAFLGRLDDLMARLDSTRRTRPALALFLLFPALLILSVFGLFPLFYSIYLSLFQAVGAAKEFVGLKNYAEAIGGAPFWKSFEVTMYFALGTVPTTLVFSFLIANGLFRITRFRNTLRTLFFLPYVTSIVAAAMVWRVMLEPREGIANLIIESLGIPAQTWLLEPRGVLHLIFGDAISPGAGPSLALCSVILFEIWRSCGFMVVVFLAGLSAVPRELEDAARIDGANALQVARNVTIPMLSPTIFFLSIVGVAGSFQAFSSIYAMTGGGRGPLDTTQNLTVYIYVNYLDRMGYASAVATLLAGTIMTFTLVQWRLFGRKVYYR